MKYLLLLLITLFSFNTVTYASFPVTEQEYEQSIKPSTEEKSFINALVSGGGPGMAIAALCCGVVGIFFMGWLLGPLAIIFGALGMKNDGRGMAIAGLVLGCLVTLLWLFLILLVGAALAGGGYYY